MVCSKALIRTGCRNPRRCNPLVGTRSGNALPHVDRIDIDVELHLSRGLRGLQVSEGRSNGVVGAGINATYRNVRAGNETLRASGIEPRGLATSSFRITWTIPRERTEEAVRALHHRFIESAQTRVP